MQTPIGMSGCRGRNKGRPRKDALADEAAPLQRAGMSYAKIATRLNLAHGEGTATKESVRKLLNNRQRESARAASSPDKTKNSLSMRLHAIGIVHLLRTRFCAHSDNYKPREQR